MKVILITYIDINSASSGSSVRPIKMYREFLKQGYEVELVSGSVGKKPNKERKERVHNLIKRLKSGEKFDFCYVESISGYMYKLHNPYDFKLWETIKQCKIPMGIFYRDIYWKFYNLFNKTSLKYKIVSLICKRELNYIRKTMDKIFVPTLEMAKHMPPADYVPLPPGCEDAPTETESTAHSDPTFIYVGGTSYQYGADLMLEAFRKANESRNVRLNLICRPEEMKLVDAFREKNGVAGWLNVIHASGEQLEEYYQRSSYAVFFGRRSVYYDFAMPVKIFEYISREKPILSTDCKALSALITENGLGMVAQDNVDSLCEGILKMAQTDTTAFLTEIRNYKANNMWKNRIDVIRKELSGSVTDAE